MKKFELSTETKINWYGATLYRIKACIDFTTTSGDEIKAGDLGGYVEKEANLSQDGKAWVWGNAEVCGDAKVCGDAEVCGDAKVCGDAEVWGNAKVCGDAEVWGNAKVCGDAEVCGDAKVCGDAILSSPNHIFNVTPIGVNANSLTLFRTKNHEIKISFQYNTYTINEFNNVIGAWDEKLVKVAKAAIEVAKLHIDLTPSASDYDACPFCGGNGVEKDNLIKCDKCGAIASKDFWNKRI